MSSLYKGCEVENDFQSDVVEALVNSHLNFFSTFRTISNGPFQLQSNNQFTMEFKTVVVALMAIAFIVSVEAGLAIQTGVGLPDALTADLATGTVPNLRTKRQFYPGFGGGGSNAFASSQASSFGGGFGGGFGGSSAQAAAGANSFGFGKKK